MADPRFSVLLFGILGYWWRGWWGLIGGLAVGFILTSVFAMALRRWQGGVLPRQVREDLIDSVLESWPDVVRDAFPDKGAAETRAALGEEIEKFCRLAARLAPKPRTLWSLSVMNMAHNELEETTDSEPLRQLYSAVRQQMDADWYQV